MNLLVTGGCGFIGSNFIRHMLEKYPDNLKDIENKPNYSFIHGDICDPDVVNEVMQNVGHVVHFAAESHVDRLIEDGSAFVRTNVLGTHTLLLSALKYSIKKFIHISTDEVYGSTTEGPFKETDTLSPSSPYYITYELPVIITRCTNNFGPYQYPEKLIPLFVTNLLENKKVGVYGTGQNVRDWIYVFDHCKAVDFVLHNGDAGDIHT